MTVSGKGGRPRKPTNLVVLEGGNAPADEPVPAALEVAAPDWLDEPAMAVWDSLAPDLEDKGLLTAWDVPAFAILCDAVARHAEAARIVAREGALVVGDKERIVKNPAAQLVRDYAAIVTTYGGRFGLTPSDRAGLSIAKADDDPHADLLTG